MREVCKIAYDAAIVGAGPAGSTAAKFLTEKGYRVLLIDKEKFPRDKPCAGGLTFKVLSRFPYVEKENLIENYTYGGIAYSPSLKYKLIVGKEEPISAMVLRKKFDYGLVKIAIASGTTFIDRKRVENIKIFKDKARIYLNDNTFFESQVVIGTDGIWSTIAKKTGLSEKCKDFGMCVFHEYPIASKSIDRCIGEKRSCHIHLGVEDIFGYGWVFPKKNHINIGICELNPKTIRSKYKTNLKEVYRNYFDLLKKNNILPNDVKIGRLKGGALPLFPLKKTFSDRVILCGDAGGFINPVSGEGIYYAMSSGKIAAQVIIKALDNGKTDERFLSEYQKIWKNDFGKDIKTFLISSKKKLKVNEKFIKIISNDEKIADMILGILYGSHSIHKIKWKLISRFFYAYFKDLFILDKSHKKII